MYNFSAVFFSHGNLNKYVDMEDIDLDISALTDNNPMRTRVSCYGLMT